MNDLIEFLLARIAEDETVARAATPGGWAFAGSQVLAHRDDGSPYWVVAEGPTEIHSPWPYNRTHIARHDPARVLGECEAKRRIVQSSNAAIDAYAVVGSDFEAGQVCTANGALRLLALPYASHPDYRGEWRP